MAESKVLITGAGGFIGSHLAELCVEQGYEVTAFVHYNSRNEWGWLEESQYRSQMKVVAGDVRDYDSVYNAMKGCEAVFHLAALIGIPYSYISPLAYIRTNIEGTYNVLQAARQLAPTNILITSTSETYGTAQYVPIDEKHPLVGQSPYSATKIAADNIALSFYRSFDLPVKVVRPFNTYGPRQSARAIIPAVIAQLLAGQMTLNLGNLHPTRDLTFVRDTAAGFIEIAKSDKLFGQVTNIGTGGEITIGDLVNLIASLMSRHINIVTDRQSVRPEKSEVERLCCNNSKLLKSTGWRPQYDLRTGLMETINWMKSHADKYKPDIYNV